MPFSFFPSSHEYRESERRAAALQTCPGLWKLRFRTSMPPARLPRGASTGRPVPAHALLGKPPLRSGGTWEAAARRIPANLEFAPARCRTEQAGSINAKQPSVAAPGSGRRCSKLAVARGCDSTAEDCECRMRGQEVGEAARRGRGEGALLAAVTHPRPNYQPWRLLL